MDVKFLLNDGENDSQKTVSMQHRYLLEISKSSGKPMTDAWCARMAMLHLQFLISSGEDMEKDLVSVSQQELAQYDARIRQWEDEQIRSKRGAA